MVFPSYEAEYYFVMLVKLNVEVISGCPKGKMAKLCTKNWPRRTKQNLDRSIRQ